MSSQNQLQTTNKQVTQLAKQNQSYLTEFIRTKEEAELVECSTQKKLSVITKEEAETLIEIVGKWGFYLGISSKMNSDDILLTCRFIKDTYQNLTIAELNLAMTLNLKGKLGKIDFYGQLSPIYISNLLNAYMDYKKENLKDLFGRAETKAPKLDTPKMSKEEEHKMVVDAILYEFGKYKEGKQVDDFFSIIYDFLKKTNRLNPTEEVVKNAEIHAKNCVERDRNKSSSSFADLLKKAYVQNEDTSRENYIKNYILTNLFSKITDINQYVSEIKVDEIV